MARPAPRALEGRRLLVVAGGTRGTASTRHRLWNYRPFLERDGVHLTWVEYGGGRLGSAPAAQAVRARFLLDLVRHAGARDVVLIQKVLAPVALVRWWRGQGCRVVYDFDDALFAHAVWEEPLAAAERRRRRFDALLAAASHVVAGSPPLAEYAREHAAGPVDVLYPSLERERFAALPPREAPAEDAAPVLGWVGNDQSQVYLRALEPVLARVLASHPRARLRVFTSRLPHLPTLPADRIEFVPWTEAGEAAAVASFDVAISPLGTEPWSRARGGRVSVLLSLAAGVPVVAAPGGGLEELVDRQGGSEPGLVFADDEGAWEAALGRLLADPTERARRAAAARALIDAHVWADVQYPAFRRAVFGSG